MATDTKKKQTRKQIAEDARQASLAGNWELALALNNLLLEKNPRDAEAYNRIGRAKLEQGLITEAIDAYTHALKVDKANLIARRNLQRLELLRKNPTIEAREKPAPRPAVFIEEVGRTWVDELVDSLPLEDLARISPGEQLGLKIENGVLIVTTPEGERLGKVDEKTAERLIQLMQNGNLYEVFALGISGRSLRVILRETYRDPRNGNLVSFPRQISATRAYLRERDSLRARDESEFILHDDDDDVEDDHASESAEDDDTSHDNDGFLDESLRIEDEDSGL